MGCSLSLQPCTEAMELWAEGTGCKGGRRAHMQKAAVAVTEEPMNAI